MGNFGTLTNPAHYIEVPDPANPGQTKRPDPGMALKVRDHTLGSALSDITTTDFGYWGALYPGVKLIDVSGDGGMTWVGPLQSDDAITDGATAGSNASTALAQSSTALSTAQQALTTAQNGPAASWDTIAGKPSTFPPTGHTHTVGQLSDAGSPGRGLLTAADAQAARAAIGAGTGNGTSNLTLGSTSTTAAPGNHAHTASQVAFTPTGSLTATNLQDATVQASQSGGGGGGGDSINYVYASGAYPTVPSSPPRAGIKVREFSGPVQWLGPTWPGVLDKYDVSDGV